MIEIGNIVKWKEEDWIVVAIDKSSRHPNSSYKKWDLILKNEKTGITERALIEDVPSLLDELWQLRNE